MSYERTPEPANRSGSRFNLSEWALRNRHRFPVDVNHAAEEELLRVPGFGVRNVKRILKIRKHAELRLEDLGRLRVPLGKAKPFIAAAGYTPSVSQLESVPFPGSFEQMSLFASTQAAVTGEL